LSARARVLNALLNARFRARVAIDVVVLLTVVARMIFRNGFARHAVVEARLLLADYFDGVHTILALWKVGTSRQRRQVFDSYGVRS